VDVTAEGNYDSLATPADQQGFNLRIKGLTGGHSGMDIHLGRGNANKLINRILYQLSKEYQIGIGEIDGGGLRNAIPREAAATITVDKKEADHVISRLNELAEQIKKEYRTTDPDLSILLVEGALPKTVLAPDFQHRLLRSIYACPNGIYRMSPDIPDLVQTSNNLARVLVKDGAYAILCLTRSSVDSEKWDEAQAIASTFELIGAKVEFSGDYPGWTPQPDSAIVQTMDELYRRLFQEKPKVSACHAGLECGILGTHYPDMEMISFGPNIRGAHSPDERVQISSVQKFWRFLLATLEKIPAA
jgi:dipeptidase D